MHAIGKNIIVKIEFLVFKAPLFSFPLYFLANGRLKSEKMVAAIVKFTQLCSKSPPTALLNFACDWLALDRDISFGRLTSPNV